MEKMKHIKEDLEELVYETLEANESTDFKHINTHELGEVIDMIKDMTEAMYYCSVIKAMENGSGTVSYTQSDSTGSTKVNINGISSPSQATMV